MKNLVFLITLTLTSLFGYSQGYNIQRSNMGAGQDSAWNVYTSGTPGFVYGSTRVELRVKDSFITQVLTKYFSVGSLSVTNTPTTGHPIFISSLTDSGTLNLTRVDSLQLLASQVGLGNVDNTRDINKPVSTAQAAAISLKFNTPTGTTTQYIRGDGTLATLPTGYSETYVNNPSVTIQTVAAAGNGNQLSTTKNVRVNYSITISSTVSLTGNATGYAVLEICPTNSSTATDWIEIGRTPSGQSGTLVIGLILTQTGGGQVSGTIPAGYYRRVRSISTSGTPSFAYNSGQEVYF